MTVDLKPDHVWVEVTSHRARQRLQRAVPDLGREFGIWPEHGWPYGELYMVKTDVAATLSIPGVKVRKQTIKGEVFRRWSMS